MGFGVGCNVCSLEAAPSGWLCSAGLVGTAERSGATRVDQIAPDRRYLVSSLVPCLKSDKLISVFISRAILVVGLIFPARDTCC